MPIVEFGFATYLNYFVVMEQIVVLLVDFNQNLVYAPMLTVQLETLTPSWAIFDGPTHLTFAPTWEKWVVSD
jgi:hypothetical protein